MFSIIYTTAPAGLPLYRSLSAAAQVIVGKREMMVAEEAPVGRQRRRMGRREHEVARAVDERALALRIRAPQHVHYSVAVRGKGLYGGVGERFPAFALVRAGLMGAHGKRGIEQEHPLAHPPREVAALRYGRSRVVVHLAEYVLE